jgi:hypothetical protein
VRIRESKKRENATEKEERGNILYREMESKWVMRNRGNRHTI